MKSAIFEFKEAPYPFAAPEHARGYAPRPASVNVHDGRGLFKPGENGRLSLLRGVTHAQANLTPIKGRAGIAGHANHVLFHLGLINRSMKGENAFADADWKGSWKIKELDEKEWSALISDIDAAIVEAVGHLSGPFEYDQISLTGTLAFAVHIGYHLGEIKQLIALL